MNKAELYSFDFSPKPLLPSHLIPKWLFFFTWKKSNYIHAHFNCTHSHFSIHSLFFPFFFKLVLLLEQCAITLSL
jgi:hypothetical protein